VPFEFISSPTDLRRNLRRLAAEAESIELFIGAIDDEKLIDLLIKAAKRGAEVNITLTLDLDTPPDAIDRLLAAGASIGIFAPAEFNRRPIARLGARVCLFDNETDWWTAALVGSLDATSASLERNLEAVTLVESDTFNGRDPAGDYLLQILQWVDALNFEPLTDRQRADHREQFEARQRLAKVAIRGRGRGRGRAGAVIEIKTPFISPLSWRELRGCDWTTYFRGLLDAEIQRDRNSPRRLSGRKGWLAGIDDGQHAFRAGPDRWIDKELRAMLLGERGASGCLGRGGEKDIAALLASDAAFRAALHEAIERCVTDPSRGTIEHAIAPLLMREGVTVRLLSRLLALAAPDRFLSILETETCLRLADMVGFDVSGAGLAPEAHLGRYLDAMEQIQQFPWASAASAERTTEHPDEADAWSKRVALLGCFVC